MTVLAPVVILIAAVIVVGPVLLPVRLGEVEHDAHDADAQHVQFLLHGTQSLLLRHVESHDHRQGGALLGEHGGVVGDLHRRGVDDHVVVRLRRLPEQRRHRRGVQQHAGTHRLLTGRQHMQVLTPVLLDHVGGRRLPGQQLGQAHLPLYVQTVADGGVADVRVDQQHVAPLLGEGDSQVDGDGAFAFGRGARRHHDDVGPVVPVRVDERQVGAQPSHLLGFAGRPGADDHGALGGEPVAARDGAQHRRVDDRDRIRGLPHTAIQHIADDGHTTPENQARDQPRRQIQWYVRGTRRFRRIGLLYDIQIDRRRGRATVVVLDGSGNLVAHAFGNAVGDIGRDLRIRINHVDVDQHGAVRIRGGDLLGESVDRHVQPQIVDDGLQHRLGFHQLRVRLDLRLDICGTRIELTDAAIITRNPLIGGKQLRRGRILGRSGERIGGDSDDDNDQGRPPTPYACEWRATGPQA